MMQRDSTEDVIMSKNTKVAVASVAAADAVSAEPNARQVMAWFPNSRGKQIVKMMRGGLPYRRAVVRSRRYYLEGKYS